MLHVWCVLKTIHTPLTTLDAKNFQRSCLLGLLRHGQKVMPEARALTQWPLSLSPFPLCTQAEQSGVLVIHCD